LRAVRERLVAAQPTAAELERLRADRNALNQLRAEIDQLQERAARMEAAATAAPKKEAPKVAIEVAADGSFSQEGNALQADALKQQLSGLPKGSRVEIRFVLDARASADVARAAVDRLVALEKELGLNLKLSFDTKPLASQ
jgi:hypothetical protein